MKVFWSKLLIAKKTRIYYFYLKEILGIRILNKSQDIHENVFLGANFGDGFHPLTLHMGR